MTPADRYHARQLVLLSALEWTEETVRSLRERGAQAPAFGMPFRVVARVIELVLDDPKRWPLVSTGFRADLQRGNGAAVALVDRALAEELRQEVPPEPRQLTLAPGRGVATARRR